MWSRILRNYNRGFTLVEVLIAVALVSFIMLMIWQTTSQSINAKKRIEKRDEVYHSARVAIDKMIQDFAQAFLLKGEPHLGRRQGSPVLKTVFKGESDEVSLASLSHLRLFKGSKESEGAEIGYKIERDPDNRDLSILFRRESKGIDDNPEEGGEWIPLAEKVKKMSLEYYDGTKFEWKNSWNSESIEKEQLPRAVKVTLVFAHPSDADEEIPFGAVALIGMNKNAIEF